MEEWFRHKSERITVCTHEENQKSEICKWQYGSESEINGQRRVSSGKRF